MSKIERVEVIGRGIVHYVTAEETARTELNFEEAKKWKTVDQELIDAVVVSARKLLSSNQFCQEYPLHDGVTLNIILPHGIYDEARLIIDIWSQPEKSSKKMRIAGYAFFEDVATNHPGFFSYDEDDKFVQVTNEEMSALLKELERIHTKK